MNYFEQSTTGVRHSPKTFAEADRHTATLRIKRKTSRTYEQPRKFMGQSGMCTRVVISQEGANSTAKRPNHGPLLTKCMDKALHGWALCPSRQARILGPGQPLLHRSLHTVIPPLQTTAGASCCPGWASGQSTPEEWLHGGPGKGKGRKGMGGTLSLHCSTPLSTPSAMEPHLGSCADY
jgi:hypothetical protein